MNVDYLNLLKLAELKKNENKQFVTKLKRKIPLYLDQEVTELHDKVFEKIDCTSCANCCTTLGPKVNRQEVDSIAKKQKQKSSILFEQIFKIDEEGDVIFKKMPCYFLGNDKLCTIYDYKPKACAEFPHTNRRRFYQLLDITLKNSLICPAVYLIVEDLKQKYK